jgi:4-diphosphocytidyl-2-C-methyl-D-erythritol kinase
MVVFPFAKINLGLTIHTKRQDGYHEISTCFYPVPLCDALEILPDKKLTFNTSGFDIPGNQEDNLCLKAFQMLKNDYQIKPVSIHLHKAIPMGAGLGGGSSDGAFMLKALNSLYSLNLTQVELNSYAVRLGSDCVFFLQEKPQFATGTGTQLTPLPLSLKDQYICIIHPGIHVSTAEAYAGVTPQKPAVPLTTILLDPRRWKVDLKNDFEKSVGAKHPEIPALISRLYSNGASYAGMSGSGSAVFGIFETLPEELNLPEDYFYFSGILP